MMPEMNGFDVCNTVKNILGIKDVYILMLTAKEQEEFDKQMGKDVGVNYYWHIYLTPVRSVCIVLDSPIGGTGYGGSPALRKSLHDRAETS
jgi:Response regulators consisting of a CheY-like receiver domain and a winged-helix DNA-binding domain